MSLNSPGSAVPVDPPSPAGLPLAWQNDGAEELPTIHEIRQLRDEFTAFMMRYKFGIDEVVTKVSILREEFAHLHDHNPIEHVSSRLKSPESIVAKVDRKGIDPSFESIRENIHDIAGVRVTCSFVSDVYRIFEALTRQTDLGVLDVRDYIADPKANGYKSLHAIVEVPVFLSDGPVPVRVEIQIRTIAMDFWASLEHKIYYKYQRQVPDALLTDLHRAATTAASLDETMERLHREVAMLDRPARDEATVVPDEGALRRLREVRRRRGERFRV